VWDDIEQMQVIDQVLRNAEGEQEVVFYVPDGSSMLRLRSRTRRVDLDDHLMLELRRILSEDRVTIEETIQTIPAHDEATGELRAVA